MGLSSDLSLQKGIEHLEIADPIGEWFELLEKAYGTRVLYQFGRISRDPSAPEWFCFNHRYADGIGAIITLMERQGMVIDGYPTLKGSRMPGRFQRWLIGLRATIQDRRLAYRYNANSWKTYRDDVGKDPCGAAWFILSRDEVAALRESVRKRGVSLNTFLLWTLNRTIPRGLVSDPHTPSLWRVPVNMRGPFLLEDVRLNHVGSLYIEIPEGLPIEKLHGRIRRELKKNVHWIGIMRLEEAKARDMLTQEGIAKTKGFIGHGVLGGRHGTGLFTNLGEWPAGYAHHRNGGRDDTRSWVVVTPSSIGAPISVGCLSWNGRLCITVNFPPGLVPGESEVRGLTGLWLREILENLSHDQRLSGREEPEGRVYFNTRKVIMSGTPVSPS